MSTSSTVRPLSPCVQICQIEPSTSLCNGCGRTLDEIAVWGAMTEAEKAPVWERLESKGYVSDGHVSKDQVSKDQVSKD
ncbi:DUF1289 domain-containing protein [Halomonas sp. HAL1]|uniref:DUF1289 domain-containing protein n=1 Tax=Halomonas sp. HAL1 TaxID=550984 RepID=UPI00022D34D8|nr:DUF1289 domain-containing protein [Halomonas sp. HAL1]EHA16277.1 hypothetical protein HAL1_07255 [Halomonas sp. HAL1]WKV91951.1 DUF1289 domain-containing protein [Halomonas sp. HAL1]